MATSTISDFDPSKDLISVQRSKAILTASLDTLLSNQIENVGKLVWHKEIVITDNDKPLQTLLTKHLSFFGEFIEITAGKHVQLRITSTLNHILLEIFSFNGATESLIDSKYYEFIKDSLDPDVNPENISFSSDINLIQKQINIGKINYEKGMFQAEKQHTENLMGINISLIELAKTLASKSNISNSFNGNSEANLSLGDNNSQSLIIQNQLDFVDKLLQVADIIAEQKTQNLPPSQLHYIEELESDIKQLKSKPIQKTEAKSWLDKVEKYISVGGSLISLSEKISPIIQELFKYL